MRERMTFCGELGRRTGFYFDLPTEAQWEYACRGGSPSAFYSGAESVYDRKDDLLVDERLSAIAWYGGNWNWAGEESGQSRAVGLKEPNAFGLYDMAGNVWEFCLDLYGEYDLSQGKDPVGAYRGGKHVVRGGSWHAWPAMCRSANRHFERGKFLGQGFRIVCMEREGYERLPHARYMILNLENERIGAEFADRLPEPGREDLYKTDRLVLTRIPAGTFLMGSPETELGRDDDETQHEVTLTADYYMGIYPVTQRQWEHLMGNNPSANKHDDYPVETVEWSEIRDGMWPAGTKPEQVTDENTLCGRLSLATGLVFKLPTEAQWEYACRAGTRTPYYNGLPCLDGRKDASLRDENLEPIAWYAGNYNFEMLKAGVGRDVGMKEPNGFGLYDMLGNAWEYCQDWYGEYGDEAVDPEGPPAGIKRVCRGGNWHAWPAVCRCAKRQKARGAFGGQSVRLVCGSQGAPEGMNCLVVELADGPQSGRYAYRWSEELPEDFGERGKIDELVLRRIPAGSFLMGSPEDEVGREEDERLHQVTLSEDYFIGIYEVTQAQWERIMGDNPSIDKGPMRAVENVDYERCGTSAGD